MADAVEIPEYEAPPPTMKLWTAVLEAQRNIEVVTKSHTAKVKTKSGTEYTYKFASTEDMMLAARVALNAAGVIPQRVRYEVRRGLSGPETVSVFRLAHAESGEFEVFDEIVMPISDQGAADKALAGSLTYSWAYWLRDVLAIPREDEHDVDRRKTDDGATRWDNTPAQATRKTSKRKSDDKAPPIEAPQRDDAVEAGRTEVFRLAKIILDKAKALGWQRDLATLASNALGKPWDQNRDRTTRYSAQEYEAIRRDLAIEIELLEAEEKLRAAAEAQQDGIEGAAE